MTSAAATGARPPILNQIDQVIAQTTCACGCGRQLTGPSDWFAGPACQQRWNARNTTSPGEVLRRGDAAVVYVGRDNRPVPLSPPTAGSTLRRRRHPVSPPSADLPQLTAADLEPLVRMLEAGIRQFGEALAGAIRQLGEALRPVLGTPQPADPRERALWLRRHRNTGPQPRRRIPPRHITPTIPPLRTAPIVPPVPIRPARARR